MGMPDSIPRQFGCPNCNGIDISENNVLPVSLRVSDWDAFGEPAGYTYPWRERGGLITDDASPRYHCHSCGKIFEEAVALSDSATSLP
jgi:rubredoxin